MECGGAQRNPRPITAATICHTRTTSTCGRRPPLRRAIYAARRARHNRLSSPQEQGQGTLDVPARTLKRSRRRRAIKPHAREQRQPLSALRRPHRWWPGSTAASTSASTTAAAAAASGLATGLPEEGDDVRDLIRRYHHAQREAGGHLLEGARQ